MRYYATISTFRRKSTNSQLHQSGLFQTEGDLKSKEISNILLQLQKTNGPTGFTLISLGYIYEFITDPHDYMNCIKSYLFGDPAELADIASFLVEFNDLDEETMNMFYDFIYSLTQ